MTCKDGPRKLALDLRAAPDGALSGSLRFGPPDHFHDNRFGGDETLVGRVDGNAMRLIARSWTRKSPSGVLIDLDGRLGVDAFDQVPTFAGYTGLDGCGRFDLMYSPLNDLDP